MNAASLRAAAAIAVPLAVALACGACDRRRSDPPERSTTSDTMRAAQPQQRGEPGTEQTPERTACGGLSGSALADCQQRAETGNEPAPEPQPPRP